MTTVPGATPAVPLTIRRTPDAASTDSARLRPAAGGASSRIAAIPSSTHVWSPSIMSAGSSDTSLASLEIGHSAVGTSTQETLRGYVDAHFRLSGMVRDTTKPVLSSTSAAFEASMRAWQSVVQRPGDAATVTAALRATQNFERTLDQAARTAEGLQSSMVAIVRRGTAEVTQLAERVAAWNGALERSDGDQAVLKQRQLTIAGRLARLAGAHFAQSDHGLLAVTVGDHTLVSGTTSRALGLQLDTATPSAMSMAFDDGTPVTVQGELGAAQSMTSRTVNGILTAITAASRHAQDLSAASAQAELPEEGARAEAAAQLVRAHQEARPVLDELASWTRQVEESAQSASRVATIAHVLGPVLSATDPTILQRHMRGDPRPDDLSAGDVATLQGLNQATHRLRTVAAQVAGDASALSTHGVRGIPGTYASTSSPRAVLPEVVGVAAPGHATITVKSVASGPVVGSERLVSKDEVLAGPEGAKLGLQVRDAEGRTNSTVVNIGEYPRVEDIASAINSSGAQVRATMLRIGPDSYQLRVTSIVTGRTTEVTVTDGQQPPSTSTIMGRFAQLEAGADTVVQVSSPDDSSAGWAAAATVSSSTSRVEGAWPGVSLEIRDASVGTSTTMTVTTSDQAVADRVGTVVEAAQRVEQIASAPEVSVLPAAEQEQVRHVAELLGSVAADTQLPGVQAKGASTPQLEWDREAFVKVWASTPHATAVATHELTERWAQIAQRISDPATGALTQRLRGAHTAGPTGDLTDVLAHDRATALLESRSHALHGTLETLGQRQSWLVNAVDGAGSLTEL